jgi:type IV pilus assembly protein PilA
MKNLKISKKKGFSLVELLVVIAVIGVIAAIAIPAMSNIFGNSRTAKIKRNAQNIASAYSAARAAGASFTGGTGGGVADAAAAVDQLNVGINGQGPFASSRFQVPLDNAEQTLAETYLVYDATNDVLQYTGTGTTP